MAMSGPIILHERSDSSSTSGAPGPSGLKPRLTPGDPDRASMLGIAAGIATVVNLLASSVLGTQLSGLIGSNEFTGTSVVSLVVTFASLAAAIVLNLLLSKRGGASARNAMILGLMLLLPPTGVGFYVVNQTLQR
jgi:hypothetical protein